MNKKSRHISPHDAPAILFDLDGTLIDSVPDIAAALNKVLQGIGRPGFTNAAVATLVGDGARTLVARALEMSQPNDIPAFDGTTTDALYQDFIAHYDAAPCNQTVLYPNALRCLVALRKQGGKLAIVTNKPEELTQRIMKELSLAQLFEVIVGASDARPLKPDPAMLDYAIQAMECKTANAVFIGDSGADVKAARAAQIPVVLLTHGYMNADPSLLNADATLDGFDQLVGALQTILPKRTGWQA
ncbi:MAG: phosphoglycolate phosphatase [Pseudomonadota bacterium]